MTAKPIQFEGPFEGWMQSSTVRDVEEAGQTAGYEYGLVESKAQTWAQWLGRIAKRKFGDMDATGHATLNGLAEAFAQERLEALADRLPAASSWAEWLAGVEVPPAGPGLPDYTRDLEIEVSRHEPSIDTYVKVGLKAGGSGIVHLRFQKWYQPHLDRVLYESSLKLEKKYGSMPMVLVFLMWPPAEGPGMTGKYVERDARGGVRRRFTYAIKRAWEIEPEEVMSSPGTMLLAPLTKGSRQRMPEIVQMIKQGLDHSKADAPMRENVWDAVYWSMGLVCDLDEAHRALGDQLAVIQQSTHYRTAKGTAFMEAHARAHREAPPLALRALLRRLATRRFGESAEAAGALEAVTTTEPLRKIAQRILTATDWQSLLAKC